MDPITQSLTGAVFAQAFLGARLRWRAALCGAVGGGLADADVFLGPWSDPALPFELHRHFTHSLLFIPLGGLLAALPFLLFRGFRERAVAVLTATMIGYATHGLLDNCTSYGTHLLWPFTDTRTAWDCMSIIDPIFTLGLLLGMIATLVRKRPAPAQVTVALALAYIAFGFVQHHRAEVVQRTLAARRGHEIERGRVMPTIGNVIVWRSIYEHDGRLYADGIRAGVFGPTLAREGESRPRYTAGMLPDAAEANDRVHRVFEAYETFADGFWAQMDDTDALDLGDMRYSADIAGFVPLWGLRVRPREPLDPVTAIGGGGDRRTDRTERIMRRMTEDLFTPNATWALVR